MIFLKYHYIMMFKLEEIIKATNAEVIKNTTNKDFFTISTDTRKISGGEIYLPLKGESFDGENFLDKAIESSAEGCFISRNDYPESANLVLKVEDTKTAYLQLANFLREKYTPKVIAITGSSGKTTTKELIYSVMNEKFKTHKTFSNHNNEIGFCETLMTMPTDTQVLIVEMGMRGLGEIDLLSKYSEPDYAVITNAGSAHIGRLGSLDNIAKAKSEIVHYLNPNGVLIAQNNERIKKFAKFDGEKIFYQLDNVEILDRKPSYSKFIYKEKEYELNVEGDYNVENSLVAIELGYLLGLKYEEIKRGLAAYKPIEKRWELQIINGFSIINDSYNANPESMKAAVSTFLKLYPNPVVVLGNMGELGENSAEFHREVGRYLKTIKESQKAIFLTVGNLANEISEELNGTAIFVKNFENNDEVSKYIVDNVNVGTTIFLKASRSMKFEEIIEKLKGEIKV